MPIPQRKRRRLFSPHTAHVLDVLRARPHHRWFVSEVVATAEVVAEGTVRPILQNLLKRGLVYRYDNGPSSPGHATVQYRITPSGLAKAKAMSTAHTPKDILLAWFVPADEDD